MALLCSGISCLSKDEVLDKTPDESDTSYCNLQIGTPTGVKWDSRKYDLHDNVAVISTDVEEPDFWRVAREEHETLWSFHRISPEGEKLYVSYDESSNDITLELKNDEEGGKKRLFELLAQKEGGYLIRAQNANNRYIRSNGEILEMFETNDPPESMQWLIVEYFDETRPLVDTICEVRYVNIKWISDNPRVDQPIPVRQKGIRKGDFEKWYMPQMRSNTVKFSPDSDKDVFATCVESLEHGVLLTKETNPDITEFKMKACSGGYKLQTKTQWIGLNDDKVDTMLIRKDHVKYGVEWTFNVIHISYRKNENRTNPALIDELVFFPPLNCEETK